MTNYSNPDLTQREIVETSLLAIEAMQAKLLMGADSQGMAQLVALQTGATQFLRVQGQGLIIDNLQTVTIGGGATGGRYCGSDGPLKTICEFNVSALRVRV